MFRLFKIELRKLQTVHKINKKKKKKLIATSQTHIKMFYNDFEMAQ